MTIILGGDSLFHNRKTPTSNPRYGGSVAAMSSSREGATGWRLHWGLRTRLDNGFVYAVCYWFLFSYTNDTLFKSFSMHLYILSYMI